MVGIDLQLYGMIGGYRLYMWVCLVGTNCITVRYVLWVLNVQMWGMIGGY